MGGCSVGCWTSDATSTAPETPARQALEEYFKNVKRPQGRFEPHWNQT